MAWSPPALKRRKWLVEQARDYAANLFPPHPLRHPDPIIEHPDMLSLLNDGAKSVYLKRLTCMPLIRDGGLNYYDVAEGRPNKEGMRPRPTLQHMTKTWLQQNEDEHAHAGSLEWLP